MVVEEAVFQHMDHRVASFLLRRRTLKSPIRITHQEIAAGLGSSREGISCILEDSVGWGLAHSGVG